MLYSELCSDYLVLSVVLHALQLITQLEVSFLPHTPTQSRTHTMFHPIAFSSHQCCHIFRKTELYKESTQVKGSAVNLVMPFCCHLLLQKRLFTTTIFCLGAACSHML